MTRDLADEVQGHVDYRVEGIQIEADDAQPTQYAAMHGHRVLLPSLEEMLARFPATREGSEVLGVALSPRCRSRWRAGCSGRSSRSGGSTTPSPRTTSNCSRRWPPRSP